MQPRTRPVPNLRSRITTPAPVIALLLALAVAPPAVRAQGTGQDTGREKQEKQEKKERDVSQFNLGKDALALQGYDPVAYFKEGGGKPAKGLDTIATVYQGVRYRFATEEHKKLFLASPEKYEPAYGGWCAFAMAKKDKVEVDPESFLTTNGRLMLFYKGFFNDTRAKWLKDEAGMTTKADKYWAELTAPPKPKPPPTPPSK